jgi:sRNA-binding carbon storage regulator CsrA
MNNARTRRSGMLALTRKEGQSLVFFCRWLRVTVYLLEAKYGCSRWQIQLPLGVVMDIALKSQNGRVHLGFRAPRWLKVHRAELFTGQGDKRATTEKRQ